MSDWEDDVKPSSSSAWPGTQSTYSENTTSGGWPDDNDNSYDNKPSFGRGRGRGGRGRGGSSNSSSGNVCYKCQKEGHFARECPEDGGDQQPKRGCFNCGKDGHMSRECPEPPKSRGTSSGCFNCGQDGHMSRECPEPPKPRNSSEGKRPSGCFNCGQEGHMSRDCPDPPKPRNSSDDKRPSGCFNCGQEGHMSRECTEPKKEREDGKPPAQTYIPTEIEDNALFEQGVSVGINFSAYSNIPVDRSGGGVIPKEIQTFAEYNLRPLLMENIAKAGYKVPTPVQKHAFPIIMGGRDLMACAQTGSGKTAAFLLPMLQHILQNNVETSFGEPVKPTGLIISPTRELAIQIFNEARKFGLGSIVKIAITYGGTSVQYQLKNILRGCHILVATPGRLIDFYEKGIINLEMIKYLVLDEADRMLDMGFLGSMKKIFESPSLPEKDLRQTLMFSATFPTEIQKLAGSYLNDYVFLVVGVVGAANTDVKQSIDLVSKLDKRETLVIFLKEKCENNEKCKILVFVETKRTADFIASYICTQGVNATSIHGDRLQHQREEALGEFKRGVRNVLVATAVAARGLDIQGVEYVMNYDLPKDIDEYVHRIGRTGRVGNQGNALSYFDPDQDMGLAKDLLKVLSDAEQEVPEFIKEYARNESSTLSYEGGGAFGAKDVRHKGRFGQRNEQSSNFGPSMGGNPASNLPQQAEVDDENWD